MTAQLLPNLAYALLLLIALLTPYAAHRWAPSGMNTSLPPQRDWAAWAVVAAAVALTFARGTALPFFSIALLLPLLGLGWRTLLGGLAAVLLFIPAIWWGPPAQAGPTVQIIFVALALCGASLPRWATSIRQGSTSPNMLIATLACGAFGLLAGLLTAPFGSIEPLYLAWHHWGAYLAPVEAWLSGGLPYRDFPVQYGLGPTALLAAACSNDCWRGAYLTAITANAAYFATLAGCTLLLTARLSRGLRGLALLALFCATFAWTGLPASFGSAAATPSVAGLRFLPISVLLLHILLAEAGKKRRNGIGHGIWLAGLFWSPETAFFATLIWWPWLAMRDAARATEMGSTPFRALLRGAARGIAALLIALCALGLTVWLLAGRTVTLGDFLAYIQHPPGPLPANPVGTVWIALAVILLAIVALVRHGFSSRTRSLYAVLLGLLGAGSYFLSRSHDNNILNLFPLLILVMLATLGGDEQEPPAATGTGFGPAFIQTSLAAMIAFVALFNITPWIVGAQRDGLFALGPQRLVERFTPKSDDAPQPLSDNAVSALTYLRGRHVGQVVLLSEEKLMPWAAPGTGWTGVNNLANFAPLPDAMVGHYIQSGALAYRRPGWLVVDTVRYGGWARLFRSAYDIREERRFGTYSAYYLVPRPAN